MKNKILLLLLSLFLVGCSNVEGNTEMDFFYFDSPLSIKLYENTDIGILKTEIDSILKSYEVQFSPSNPDSVLTKLNSKRTLEVSNEFIELTNISIEYCNITNNRFDISSGNLIKLWSINNENNLPSQEQIDKATLTSDCNGISINGNTITLSDGISLDYGSVVKGYVADVVKEYLISQGIDSAIINFGGNIQTIGTKDNNQPFKIAVMKPTIDNITNENIATIEVKDKSVVTSGINQRFFTDEDGNVYHHILDAETGKPVDNNIASVTIVTSDSAQADILSTVLFIMGVDYGLNLANTTDDLDVIFVTRDKKIFTSDNLEGLSIIDSEYTLEK